MFIERSSLFSSNVNHCGNQGEYTISPVTKCVHLKKYENIKAILSLKAFTPLCLTNSHRDGGIGGKLLFS